MPIVHRTNNRVLPANARAADVAKDTINRILPVQNRKYDAAFQVDGYSGVLYHRLGKGFSCACSSHKKQLTSRLGEDGKADEGTINELLTGGLPFGVRAYGSRQDVLEIDSSLFATPRTDSPSVTARSSITGSHLERWAPSELTQAGVSTVIDDGEGPNGPVAMTSDLQDFAESVDLSIHSNMDVSCPVCFGTGFVGGFSVFNGWRRSLVPYEPTCTLPPAATLSYDNGPCSVLTDTLTWTVTLPKGCVSVDAFRLFNGEEAVPANFFVDNRLLVSAQDIAQFCDGVSHEIRVDLGEERVVTHLEIQINQSANSANFAFPKTSRSSNTSLLDSTDEVSVVFSPLVSLVRPLDIVFETTTGRFFRVTSCSEWRDARSYVLGWESSLRVTQPQELFNLLPRRSPVLGSRQQPYVRDNLAGPRT